jgi:endonuclease III
VSDTIMTTTVNKQRLLTHLLSSLGKAGKAAEPDERPVLEQFVYALCREGTTRELADQAFGELRDRFYDWNEVRVSSAREVADVIDMLPGNEARAQRVIEFLQEVFETTFSFDLEGLHKKGLKQAAKQLARYQRSNDYGVAWVVQQSLGGHAIPLDAPTLRVLRRVGLVEEEGQDLEALRASLEHQIPKARGPQFADVVSEVAQEYCWKDGPRCPSCPLVDYCLTAQEMRANGELVTRKPR